jgi:hypothetical protein
MHMSALATFFHGATEHFFRPLTRVGRVHISEVQEKDFKREALSVMWAEHARAAKAQAKLAFEENERSA